MKKEKFSGWKVAFGVFILVFTIIGAMSTLPVFLLDILTTNKLEMNKFMLMVSFTTVSMAVFSAVAGQVLEKLGIRKVLLVVLVTNIIYWAGMGYATKYWMFYAINILAGMIMAFSTFVPTAILINRWFIDKRATIMGAIYSGMGFGGALFVPLSGLLLDRIGNYRLTYLILGGIISIIIVLCMSLIKDNPEKYGEKPYGWEKQEESIIHQEIIESKELPGVTFSESLKTGSFWLCIIAILFAGMTSSVINFVIPYLTVSGIATVTASNIHGLLALIMGVAILLFGIFADKFGIKNFAIVTGALLTIGLFLFANIEITVITALIISMIYASGNAYSSSIQSLIPNPIFGPREYQKIVGPFNGALSLGLAIGAVALPTVLGSGDSVRQYQLMYGIAASIALISVVLILIAFAIRPYRVGEKD